MPTMKNSETGEMRDMSADELAKAMREGKVSIQQQIQHADGAVTSSTIYGNNIGDGIDRSLNIFGTAEDLLVPILQKMRELQEDDENAGCQLYMDDSDVDYEVTFDDTGRPITLVISCTKEGVTVSGYLRDNLKTIDEPLGVASLLFKNGEIKASIEDFEEEELALLVYAFAVNELRQILRDRGILQELQRIGNKSSGVLIRAAGEDDIDARIVRGKARPDLPCTIMGDDSVMMRPYLDELMADTMFEDMSLEEKIAAAEDGDTDMMEKLAIYYLDECDEPDAEKTVYWFKKMADAGIPVAMFNLGLHYAEGYGVEQSFENAVYWLEKAAENGDEDAPDLIERFKKAIPAEKSAHTGDAQAQAVLADVYMFMAEAIHLSDAREDYAVALDYAQQSAAQNNSDGICLLALAYAHGRGVPENKSMAMELYRKGGESGSSTCWHHLGCLLLDEEDPGKEEEGFALCVKAAEMGNKAAMQTVGRCYDMGCGVKKDIDAAYQWYRKALEKSSTKDLNPSASDAFAKELSFSDGNTAFGSTFTIGVPNDFQQIDETRPMHELEFFYGSCKNPHEATVFLSVSHPNTDFGDFSTPGGMTDQLMSWYFLNWKIIARAELKYRPVRIGTKIPAYLQLWDENSYIYLPCSDGMRTLRIDWNMESGSPSMEAVRQFAEAWLETFRSSEAPAWPQAWNDDSLLSDPDEYCAYMARARNTAAQFTPAQKSLPEFISKFLRKTRDPLENLLPFLYEEYEFYSREYDVIIRQQLDALTHFRNLSKAKFTEAALSTMGYVTEILQRSFTLEDETGRVTQLACRPPCAQNLYDFLAQESPKKLCSKQWQSALCRLKEFL